ncbi:SMI1/KNR4 family protein [Streptomyces sp. NPDC001515]
MTQEFDLAASLSRGVESRTAAWAFVQDFAAHWAGAALDGSDGWTEADLAAAEARLGIPLPAALREAYALFGRRRDLTSNHDVLLDPAHLYIDEAREALVFRHENQGAASWGVLLEHLPADDPSVFIRLDLADKSAEQWETWLERLSVFFVELVLSESLHADGELCDVLEPGDDSMGPLETHFARLPVPACPAGERTRWFLGQDVLVRDDDGAALLARGRTVEAVDHVRELIGGDWLNG